MLNDATIKKLIDSALSAREKSYSPYSGFSVGAALLTAEGEIFTGANIESASFSPTVCAERVALFTAIHQGKKSFSAIAVAGGKSTEDVSSFCAPCGVCRQVMCEFCSPDFTVILYDGKAPKILTLSQLLPESFTNTDLK